MWDEGEGGKRGRSVCVEYKERVGVVSGRRGWSLLYPVCQVLGDNERCLQLLHTYEECGDVDLALGTDPTDPSLSAGDAYNLASLLKM